MTSFPTVPPPDGNLRGFHAKLDAAADLHQTLKTSGQVTFRECERIAAQYGLTCALLLQAAELDERCTVDYARGLITCP